MIIFHERYLEHRQDFAEHPERPERLTAIMARLAIEGLWCDVLTPEPAPWEDLARVHDEAYLRRLERFGAGHWDADTYVRPETFAIARLAAGGVILAAEQAWTNACAPVLALPRPPGHHATADQAMGFCYLNNIAIAAARLLAEGKGPLAIVDLDVHHGNGTEEAFLLSREVLFISLHEYPFYPGTGSLGEIGAGLGKGFTVNIPLPAGSGDPTYAEAFDRIVEPILAQFAPKMILVSIGTDAHYRDPLAMMALTSPGYVQLVDRLWRMAGKYSAGRMACCLEGGYDLESLAEVIAGVAALGRTPAPTINYRFTEDRDCLVAGRPVIDRVVETLKPYWKLA